MNKVIFAVIITFCLTTGTSFSENTSSTLHGMDDAARASAESTESQSNLLSRVLKLSEDLIFCQKQLIVFQEETNQVKNKKERLVLAFEGNGFRGATEEDCKAKLQKHCEKGSLESLTYSDHDGGMSCAGLCTK